MTLPVQEKRLAPNHINPIQKESTTRMRSLQLLLPALMALLFPTLAAAQFGGFFDQMFGGQQQQQQQQQHNPHHHHGGGGGNNGPSDSSFYRANVDRITCDKYLCPDTLGTPPRSVLILVVVAHAACISAWGCREQLYGGLENMTCRLTSLFRLYSLRPLPAPLPVSVPSQ